MDFLFEILLDHEIQSPGHHHLGDHSWYMAFTVALTHVGQEVTYSFPTGESSAAF